LISKFVSLINCVDDSYKINPANESVRKMLLEDKREELERLKKKSSAEKKDNDYIGTSVDIICYGDSSINYLNVEQYKIYQLLKSVKMKTKRISYDQIMNGIYSGTIDSTKINKSDLTWIE